MQLKNKKKFELPALKSNISQHEVLQLWLIRWIGLFLTDRSQRVRIGQVYLHPVTPNEGIPQGTKLAPLLFAILVNNLCREWRYRIKYVDDTLVFESIPRCSPSYLPFIAANINTYTSKRNMRLNEKKCKDMVINFLKYQPTVIIPIQLNQGRIQDFFLGGGALVSCSTSTPINHIVFFLQNTSCIRKPQHPLHPPPRSAPVNGPLPLLSLITV